MNPLFLCPRNNSKPSGSPNVTKAKGQSAWEGAKVPLFCIGGAPEAGGRGAHSQAQTKPLQKKRSRSWPMEKVQEGLWMKKPRLVQLRHPWSLAFAAALAAPHPPPLSESPCSGGPRSALWPGSASGWAVGRLGRLGLVPGPRSNLVSREICRREPCMNNRLAFAMC